MTLTLDNFSWYWTKNWNIHIILPWVTLTFDLWPWPWPLNLSEIWRSWMCVLNFSVLQSAYRLTDTHTQTKGTDFIYHDEGGNNIKINGFPSKTSVGFSLIDFCLFSAWYSLCQNHEPLHFIIPCIQSFQWFSHWRKITIPLYTNLVQWMCYE